MSDNPKISVIVPVYNAEKYLRRCIDSILNQTFTDFEVLLINDGSTDSSGVICDEYAKQDSRVRVFHKENGGVSSARQLGVDKAVGIYSIHIDSDDWIANDMLEYLKRAALEKRADIVICDLYSEYHGTIKYSSFKPSGYTGRDLFTYILDATAEKSEIIAQVANELSLTPFAVQAKTNKRSRKNYKHHIDDLIVPPVTKWLRAFYDAKFVVTDSFHGCVFSILFNKDLYICVRDKNSYTIALKNFTNAKVLLVPDMAFYMKGVDLCKNTMVYNKSLFLKRRDIELSDKSYDDLFIDEKLEISDWPTFERKYLYWFILRILVKLTKENPIKEIDFFMRNVTNKFAYCVHRPYLINKGISFLMKYNKIYTTRLHVGILGVLLSKNVFFLDNSYGKLGGFYKCWLRNSEKISYKS